MDTLILFALIGCAIIGFVIGGMAGAVVMHDLDSVPDLTVDAERSPEDPEDDW